MRGIVSVVFGAAAVVGAAVTVVVAFPAPAMSGPVAVLSVSRVSRMTVNAVRAISIAAPAARIHGLSPGRGGGVAAGPDAGVAGE